MSTQAEARYRAAKERLAAAPDDLATLKEFSEAARAGGHRPEALDALKAAYARRATPDLYSELRMVCTFPEFQAIAKPPESPDAAPKQAGTGAELLPRKPFPLLLDQVIFYPVQDGLSVFILITCAVLISIGHLFYLAGMLGIAATVICVGIVFGYLWSVMHASGMGEKRTRGWPDFTNPEEFGTAIVQYFMVSVICFGPSLAFLAWAPIDIMAVRLLGAIALALLGVAYYPMALMLAGFTHNFWEALNLPSAIRSISRMPVDYVICLAFFVFSYLFVCGGEWVIRGTAEKAPMPLWLILMFFVRVINVYLLIVQMRTVGVLYYSREKDLGWFQ